MSTSPKEYEPEYVELDDIPLEVEDRYSSSDKREALSEAETEFELDINGGFHIAESELTSAHLSAVVNLATYYLVRGATSPDDITLGDLEDGGEQSEIHAEQYFETYERLLVKISEAGREGQPGSYMGATGNTGGSVTVNTKDRLRTHTGDKYFPDS